MTIFSRIGRFQLTTTLAISLISLIGCGQSAESLRQAFGRSSDSKESASNLAGVESNRAARCAPNSEEKDEDETEESDIDEGDEDEADENESHEEDDENESGLDLHREKKKEKSKQKKSVENGCPASTSTSTSVQTSTGTSPMTGTQTNTNTAPTTSTATSTSTTAALDGALLYKNLCENCHNPKATTDIVDKSAAGIRSAIQNVRSMRSIQATDAELSAISKYLTTP